MDKLIRGVHKFKSSVVGARRALFERLANRQEPLALFIACSDSRVNPALITQTEPGDLFVMRNAGNIVPPHGVGVGGEEATIEYAVDVLRIRDIIVCGHSNCGAMSALVTPDATRDLPAVRRWLAVAQPTNDILKENYGDLAGDALVTAAIKENVLVQLDNLRSYPSVAAALDEGRVNLHGWVYRIESGDVLTYEPERSAFVPLAAPADGASALPRDGGERA